MKWSKVVGPVKYAFVFSAVALVTFGGTMFARTATHDPSRSSSLTSAQATVSQTGDLDSVPGFGKTAPSMLRDDAIALHEAFRRELLTKECMQRLGYDYIVAQLADSCERARVASYLGLKSEARAADTWSTAHDDGYFLALYGLTKAQVDQGAGGIVGGCAGESWKQVPGIWDLKQRLGDDQATMLQRVDEAMSSDRAIFTTCVSARGIPNVRRPEDLGTPSLAAQLGKSSSARLRLDVSQNCTAPYEAEHASVLRRFEDQFVTDHPELAAAKSQYANATSEIKSDTAFISFLTEGP